MTDDRLIISVVYCSSDSLYDRFFGLVRSDDAIALDRLVVIMIIIAGYVVVVVEVEVVVVVIVVPD